MSPVTSCELRKVITDELNLKINLNLNHRIISKPVHTKYSKNLNEKSNRSKLNDKFIPRPLHKKDLKILMKNWKILNWIIELFQVPFFNKIKNHVAKIATKTKSKITAELLDPKMPGAFLNSVNPSFKSKKGGRVPAVVAKQRYQIGIEN